MGSIDIVTGSKEELPDDLQALARKRSDNPRIIAATGKDIRPRVAEKTSALFLDEREVLVLIDPEREVLDEIKDQIERLKERMPIIIYSTTDRTDIASVIKGTAVKLQGKDARVRETIRSLLRKSGKKMTEKAFHAFIERVKEEGLLETELEKLIAYTGSKQTIDSKDLESVMIKTHEDTFFSLLDALAAKDRKKTVETLDHLVSQGLPLMKPVQKDVKFLSYVLLGGLLVADKEYESALNQFDQARTLEPDRIYDFVDFGRLYLLWGKTEQAVREWKDVQKRFGLASPNGLLAYRSMRCALSKVAVDYSNFLPGGAPQDYPRRRSSTR